MLFPYSLFFAVPNLRRTDNIFRFHLSNQLWALSYQLWAFSYQFSAISFRLSALGFQISAFGFLLSPLTSHFSLSPLTFNDEKRLHARLNIFYNNVLPYKF